MIYSQFTNGTNVFAYHGLDERFYANVLHGVGKTRDGEIMAVDTLKELHLALLQLVEDGYTVAPSTFTQIEEELEP